MADYEDDPVEIARKKRILAARSNFPAVNAIASSRNTAFARNAPVNTIQQNLDQIPIGGLGLGALNQAGYSRSPQVNFIDFLNQPYQQPSPPQFQYNTPGLNIDPRALTDPSVGGLDNSIRFKNNFGQNVTVGPDNGLMVSGKGPTYGALQGSTANGDIITTPSGGQIRRTRQSGPTPNSFPSAFSGVQQFSPQYQTQNSQGGGSYSSGGGLGINLSDRLLLASGIPTRDPGLNLLNGVSPEQTAAYWKRIEDSYR